MRFHSYKNMSYFGPYISGHLLPAAPRKAVGSGEHAQRGCGWEEEMREQLEQEWREGAEGYLDLSGCYTHRALGKMCACYTDRCNTAGRTGGVLGLLLLGALL